MLLPPSDCARRDRRQASFSGYLRNCHQDRIIVGDGAESPHMTVQKSDLVAALAEYHADRQRLTEIEFVGK